MAQTTIKPLAHGYRTLTPYLVVQNSERAVSFYEKAFGAQTYRRVRGPNNMLMHAELKLGDSVFMVSEEHMDSKGPVTLGGTPVSTCIYVDNVDEFTEKAVKAGATVTRPVENKFFGDRMGSLRDPFGHIWHVATHIEDMSDDEMQRRAQKAFTN